MSWRRYHDDRGRAPQDAADISARLARRGDRAPVARSEWVDRITSMGGPPDPMTRLVLLALASAMRRDDRCGSMTAITQDRIAQRAAVSVRTVRDRIAWADAHGWVRIAGHRRRVYTATVPMGHTMPVSHRRAMPDTPAASVVPIRPRGGR